MSSITPSLVSSSSIAKKIPTALPNRPLVNSKTTDLKPSTSVNKSITPSDHALTKLDKEIEEANRLHTVKCPKCMNEYNKTHRKLTEACGHSLCFRCLVEINDEKAENGDEEAAICPTCIKLSELYQRQSLLQSQATAQKQDTPPPRRFDFNGKQNSVQNDPFIVDDSLEEQPEAEEDTASDIRPLYNSSTASTSSTSKNHSKSTTNTSANIFDLGEKLSKSFNQNSSKMMANKLLESSSSASMQSSMKNSSSSTSSNPSSFGSFDKKPQRKNVVQDSSSTDIYDDEMSQLADLSRHHETNNTTNDNVDDDDDEEEHGEDDDDDDVLCLEERDSKNNLVHFVQDDDTDSDDALLQNINTDSFNSKYKKKPDGYKVVENGKMGQSKLPMKMTKSNLDHIDENVFVTLDDDDDDEKAEEEKDLNDLREQELTYTNVYGVEIPDIERYPKMNWLFSDIEDYSKSFREYFTYKHSISMMDIFKRNFGLHRFRPQQSEAINAALLGKFSYLFFLSSF
jgi:hypothetical protein